mmetsp:Transcript_36577/g.76127  ORF Transcript_36577/g.76127 Transcript_36577/m.76127 type:complete len:407 (-) Transcript_36577:168-1388(-)
MTTTTTPRPTEFPPWVHALGGSVGSALALLLLYPLERARIELQASVAAESKKHPPVVAAEEAPGVEQQEEMDEEESWMDANDDESPRSQTNNNQPDPYSPDVMATTTTHGRQSTIHRILVELYQRGELYRGVGPIVTTLLVSNFIFFGAKSQLQKFLQPARLPNNNHHHAKSLPNSKLISLLSSTLAGMINVLLTNPLWVTNLRIVTHQSTHDNLWKELWHMVQTQQNLWQGTTSSLWLVSNPVLQLVSYEWMRHLVLSSKPKRGRVTLSPLQAFGLGALSKALATVVTHPLQLAQACQRLNPPPPTSVTSTSHNNHNDSDHDQDEPQPQQPHYHGTLDCLRQLYHRHDGNILEAWYTGFPAKLLQTVLTAALQFLTYEQILYAIHRAVLLHRPRDGPTSHKRAIP